jgi:hypothetical protein
MTIWIGPASACSVATRSAIRHCDASPLDHAMPSRASDFGELVPSRPGYSGLTGGFERNDRAAGFER